jgi:dynein heavy chain
MKRKEANSVSDKLGFPSGMTYGHRSSLRKECLRFLRFAYLADFLSLDALSKIYTGSVSKMIERLESLNDSIDMEKIMGTEFDDDGGNGMQAQRGQEPLFYINVTIEDSKPIHPDEIVDVPIDDFIPPTRGTSQVKDFDLL